MKYKHAIALFLAGFILYLSGAVFKVTHAPHADLLLKIASAVMILAVIIAIIKLLLTKDKKNFLNQ